MWENMRGSETSLLRLQQLVKSRYGKGVKVLPITDVSDRHVTKDSFTAGLDLHIPIVVEQNYLGTAVVSHGRDLSEHDTKSLVETIKMVLEPKLYNRWLQRKENNLQEVSKVDFSPEQNLVLFNDLEEKYFDFTNYNEKLDVRLVSNIIHLYGINDFFNRRVAHQIHEMTHRWAFLPLGNLDSLKNVDDLLNLGAVTLFVEKLEELRLEMQNLICDYLKSPRSSSEPLIVTASALSLSELKNCPVLSPNIIEEIALTSFEVDRAPLSLRDLKELLEMMFLESSIPHS